MTTLFFEDFHSGFTLTHGPFVVTRAEILAYAAAFDPQPFHLDDDAARDTPLGGLAASGWHTGAVGMRMIFDAFVGRSASLGAPGIEEVRWLVPVRPGDALTLHVRVTAARLSRSKPDRGIVGFAFQFTNQDGACVMTQANSIMMGRRPPSATTAP